MKKLLLLFTIVVFFKTTKSQVVFCPPGSSWTYACYGMSWAKARSITYVGDSILSNGETVKRLKCPTFFKYYLYFTDPADGVEVLVKQSGDTVFLKNVYTSGSWQVLYNFAATPGQQWVSTFKDSLTNAQTQVLTYTTQVLSVSTVTLNNVAHKQLRVTYKYANTRNAPQVPIVTDTTIITERIGSRPYMFNFFGRWRGNDVGVPSALMCYRDNGIGTIDNLYSRDCSYPLGLSENKISGNIIKLYAQPANNMLIIETNTTSQNIEIRITDLLGYEVLNSKPQHENSLVQIDVSTLAKGVYIVQLYTDKKLSGSGKIIKE